MICLRPSNEYSDDYDYQDGHEYEYEYGDEGNYDEHDESAYEGDYEHGYEDDYEHKGYHIDDRLSGMVILYCTPTTYFIRKCCDEGDSLNLR